MKRIVLFVLTNLAVMLVLGLVVNLLGLNRFLSANGWKEALSRERQLAVLYRYNHSHAYTRTIMAVADRLRGTDSGGLFGSD